MMSKCDSIALLYENDRDHLDFIRENISKLPQLTPKILIQTKMDLIQQHSEQITFQDDFAKELGGIKLYTQISVQAKKIQEALDLTYQVCLDPSKGLTDESLEIAKEQNDGSFYEDWDLQKLAVVSGLLISGISFIGYAYLKKQRKF